MWRIALLGLVGCGRILFDPRSDAGDAPADSQPDGCPLGAWSAPTRVTSLATASADYGPSLRADGTTLVFTSTRTGGSGSEDLYVTSVTGPLQFQSPVNLTMFNTASNEYGGAWAALDELYFSSEITGNARIYSTSFDGVSFGPATMVPELVGVDLRGVSITGDGLEMFFADSGQTALGRATRTSRTDPWVVVETSIPVLGPGSFPSVSRDGLELYFQSARTGPVRIFVATRTDRQSSFGAPTIVSLGGDGSDNDPEISADRLTLLFGSTRSGGSGSYDLYGATRSCL